MDLAKLIEEAESLSRPVTYLVPAGASDRVGFWWGPSPGSRVLVDRVWLALDCTLVPELEIPVGILQLSFDSASGSASATIADSWPSRSGPAQPLRPVPGRSLPPMDALFRLGSDAIGQWLEARGWQRDWGYNSNFPDDVARQYEQVFEERHPLYTDSVWATVGGWHFPWPDGDWDDRLHDTLLVTTYRDSEPWLEIWATADDGLQALARIT